MNFDINQDLSTLQSKKPSRNRRIRPGKAKAAASAPLQDSGQQKPVAQQPCDAQQQPEELPEPAAQAKQATQPIPPAAVTAVAPAVTKVCSIDESPNRSAQQAVGFQQPSLVRGDGEPQPTSQVAVTRERDLPTVPASNAIVAPLQGQRRVAAHAGPSARADLPGAQREQADGGGPSRRETVSIVPPIPDPPDQDSMEEFQEPFPAELAIDGMERQPAKPRRRAPARKRALPDLGTNISKKPPKPRKKKKKEATEVIARSSSPDPDCSTALVTCDTDVDNVEQPSELVHQGINRFDEMTRALCPGKRQKGKRKKIDPSAPIDPKNMTLLEVIMHAQCNANILDRQYKESKSLQQKEKERAAAAEEEAAPEPPPPMEAEPAQAPLAPQLIIRDGKIVVDESSLRVQAAGAIGLNRQVDVEDDDDTLINSHSFLPVSKLTKERWTRDDTILFYDLLSNVGADFTLIASFFKGRTRKQVKNKYLKEQKVNPARVLEAMSGPNGATLAYITNKAKPGTGAAGYAALLPGGENVIEEGTGTQDDRTHVTEEENQEYLGDAVDSRAADFFYWNCTGEHLCVLSAVARLLCGYEPA